MTVARRRAVIVGAGLMGRWHAHAVHQVGGDIVAVVDPTAQRAAQLARRYGARALSSLTAVDAADIVHICTPTDTHQHLIDESIQAGRHVLVEKPLAATAAATRELLTRAASAGVRLCPVHQFPWQAGARRVHASLARLGPIRHVDFTACSAGASGASMLDPDRVALDILPHPFSLLYRFVPSAMTSRWTAVRPERGEWRLSTTTGGTSVSILVSMSGRPTTNMLRLIGERGTAHLDLFHGFGVIESSVVSRFRKILHPFAYAGATAGAATATLLRRTVTGEYAYPGLRALIGEFYRSTDGPGEPPVSFEEAILVAERIDELRVVGREGSDVWVAARPSRPSI